MQKKEIGQISALTVIPNFFIQLLINSKGGFPNFLVKLLLAAVCTVLLFLLARYIFKKFSKKPNLFFGPAAVAYAIYYLILLVSA